MTISFLKREQANSSMIPIKNMVKDMAKFHKKNKKKILICKS